jgi:hypothetical protein
LRFATEIKELDINPLLGNEKEILAVDARVRIGKKSEVGRRESGVRSRKTEDRDN